MNNKPERTFGIAPIAGDFLILEYIEPLESKEESTLVVSHIVHGFRPNPFSDPKRGKRMSGDCHNNVACPEGHGKTDMINSVALLLDSKGESFCTGAMINNALRDGRQLFLTADHCISKNGRVTNYIVGFGYQMRYCKSTLEPLPTTKTVHGMKLLGRAKDTDFAMLEVQEDIPDAWNVYMAGWDAMPATTRVGSFFGIHHPSGDVKKVSLYTGSLDLIRMTEQGPGANYWRIPKWSSGVTEPGSSGSPLFDGHGYIIGHLYGGDSKCDRLDGPDYYGALSKDWDFGKQPIKNFLDPKGMGILKVKGGYLKDLKGDSDDDSLSSDDERVVAVPGATVTVTATATLTVTTTTAKSTKTITATERVTVTKEARPVTLTSTTTLTSTETFMRVQPAATVTRTVTVTPRRSGRNREEAEALNMSITSEL